MQTLPEGKRYRCRGCGNLTRFDVVTTRRTQEFLHADLSGAARVEESHILSEVVELVSCRWCSNGGDIEIVDKPGSSPELSIPGPIG